MFAVVGIGRHSDTGFALSAKLAVQTVSLWEESKIHYVRHVKLVSRVVRDMVSDLKQLREENGMSASVPYDEHSIHRFFIVWFESSFDGRQLTVLGFFWHAVDF